MPDPDLNIPNQTSSVFRLCDLLCFSKTPLTLSPKRSAIFVSAPSRLSSVLSEVTVHGLHSGALRASGSSLSAAASLSLLLTTRLSQQMALTLTPKDREAADNRVGRCETKLCGPSRTNPCVTDKRALRGHRAGKTKDWTLASAFVLYIFLTFLFNQAQMVKYDQKQKGEEKDKYQPVGEWECGCTGN